MNVLDGLEMNACSFCFPGPMSLFGLLNLGACSSTYRHVIEDVSRKRDLTTDWTKDWTKDWTTESESEAKKNPTNPYFIDELPTGTLAK